MITVSGQARAALAPGLQLTGAGEPMSEPVTQELTHAEVLRKLLAAERKARELLEEAACGSADPEQRALFERLARHEQEAVAELQKEKERLEAAEFVQRALDC
jgi:rubrerythrin